MIETILMPKLGFNMDEGRLVKWYKKEDESIKKGEPFFAVETDKTSIDIEATRDGVVRKRLVEEGELVPVTLPIAILSDGQEELAAELAAALTVLGKSGGAAIGRSGATQVPEGAAAAAPEATMVAAEPKTAASAPETTAAPGTTVRSGASTAERTGEWDYDIAVIGGGPGGYVAAIRGAQLGKRVALIEAERLGGTCLNHGCIPTKTLLRSVEALNEARRAGELGVAGIDLSRVTLDLAQVQKRKNQIVGQLADGVSGLLRGNGVAVLKGEGRLLDNHTVGIGGETITAGDCILATGSESKALPVSGGDKRRILTSGDLLEMTVLPKTAAIAGGGVIGVEFAYFLACAGAKVTILEFMDRLLPMADQEIAAQTAALLQRLGVEIYTGARLTAVTERGVTFEKDGAVCEAPAEKVLAAVGRAPRLRGIDCEGLGIATERGAIVTDDRLRTTAKHVYAVGDVNGKAMLAHGAAMEGIVAAETICGLNAVMEYDKIPSAIYIRPEIAWVGLTEEQARAQYGKAHVGRFPLAANAKAKTEGEEAGMVKVIAEPAYGGIVGVHLCCPHATELIAQAAGAMKLEGTAEELAATVYPHPTISEAVCEAMRAALGKAIHAL